MENIDILKGKYSSSILQKLDKENFSKIITFLQKNKCDYILDIVDEYLDIFTFEYAKFVEKFDKLNKKYNNEFLDKAGENMNLFEEFFEI